MNMVNMFTTGIKMKYGNNPQVKKAIKEFENFVGDGSKINQNSISKIMQNTNVSNKDMLNAIHTYKNSKIGNMIISGAKIFGISEQDIVNNANLLFNGTSNDVNKSNSNRNSKSTSSYLEEYKNKINKFK
jgi:hypothetical protein